jgi:hypothetical protein
MRPQDCKTKEDILIYLVTNLNYIHDEVRVGDYQQIMGFRLSLCISQVWYNHLTTKWYYHVDRDMGEFTGDANMGEYISLLELLNGVTDRYYDLWKL